MKAPIRFLIIPKDEQPYYTHWFSLENNYTEGMIVVDLLNNVMSKDATRWDDIAEDHL